MESNLLGTRVDAVLTAVLEAEPDVLLAVNPSADAVEALVETAATYDDALPTIRVLADERVLKTVMDDFLVASLAADLVHEDSLSLRYATDLPRNSVLLTADRTVALVTVGDEVGGIAVDDASFVTAAFDAYETDWEDAESFGLRTPPISDVRDTLGDDIGPDVREDFESMLASLETARGDGDGLDEVTISLLVAARNNVLLYDISRWGEDVGIASKATFSRTKTRLEDKGIVGTEKVPIDVGRPRLRLRLADDRLADADPSELASVAASVLAS
jgi:hypothetical protein